MYEFQCLPFGLNLAPFLFTKLLKPVAKKLRLMGIVAVFYLDDILIISSNEVECKEHTHKAATLLNNLGFIINLEKSTLVPRQTIKFLGFMYDTVNMRISLPQEKILGVQKIISKFKKNINKNISVREFAKFIGKLVAACPATKYGFIHLKPFEIIKHTLLNCDYRNYDKKMLKQELEWWNNNIGLGQDIKPTVFSLEIFSDASTTGWGAFCEGTRCHGFWDNQEIQMHINYLEIKAAYYALKSFGKNLKDSRILLRIDNQTAISCINRGGSVKYRLLNKAAKELWQWCEIKNLSVFATYIPTSHNVEADKESRSLSVDTEYELNKIVFKKIVQKLGCPEIDLFATKLNKKCKKFISWFPDPDSVTVDSFTVDWSKYFFYAFPPFSIITKVLEKIIQEKASGIVVVPYWPAQPWYPVFIKLLIKNPIHFRPQEFLLISPFRERHPLHKEISLVAGKLYGGHI